MCLKKILYNLTNLLGLVMYCNRKKKNNRIRFVSLLARTHACKWIHKLACSDACMQMDQQNMVINQYFGCPHNMAKNAWVLSL